MHMQSQHHIIVVFDQDNNIPDRQTLTESGLLVLDGKVLASTALPLTADEV